MAVPLSLRFPVDVHLLCISGFTAAACGRAAGRKYCRTCAIRWGPCALATRVLLLAVVFWLWPHLGQVQRDSGSHEDGYPLSRTHGSVLMRRQ
jgi:hypothetical protein